MTPTAATRRALWRRGGSLARTAVVRGRCLARRSASMRCDTRQRLGWRVWSWLAAQHCAVVESEAVVWGRDQFSGWYSGRDLAVGLDVDIEVTVGYKEQQRGIACTASRSNAFIQSQAVVLLFYANSNCSLCRALWCPPPCVPPLGGCRPGKPRNAFNVLLYN